MSEVVAPPRRAAQAHGVLSTASPSSPDPLTIRRTGGAGVAAAALGVYTNPTDPTDEDQGRAKVP